MKQPIIDMTPNVAAHKAAILTESNMALRQVEVTSGKTEMTMLSFNQSRNFYID